jgi:hypothetical protein
MSPSRFPRLTIVSVRCASVAIFILVGYGLIRRKTLNTTKTQERSSNFKRVPICVSVGQLVRTHKNR